jgi:hypothetical protein
MAYCNFAGNLGKWGLASDGRTGANSRHTMHPIIRGICGGILGAALAIAFSCQNRIAWIIVMGQEALGKDWGGSPHLTEAAIFGLPAGAIAGLICVLLQARAKGKEGKLFAWPWLVSFLLVSFLVNLLPVNQRVRE